MRSLAGLSIALIAVLFSICAARAQTVAPSTAPPVAPSPAPPKIGPVLVNGKSTFVLGFDQGNSKTVTASQTHSPPGQYFVATPGTICIGSINVSGSDAAIPNGAIISSGPFTFTRVGNTSGCAVSITSSAGGLPAIVVFQ